MSTLKNAIPFKAEGHTIEYAFAKSFSKAAKSVFTRDELSGLLNYLSANPDAGKVVPHTGGLRKVRWAAKGQGKRGGGRVIYYFRDLNIPLLLLTVYAKGETNDLSVAEYKAMEAKVEIIIANILREKASKGFSQSSA